MATPAETRRPRLGSIGNSAAFASSFKTAWAPSVGNAVSNAGSTTEAGNSLQDRLLRTRSRHFPISAMLLQLWYLGLLPPLLCALSFPLELLYLALGQCYCVGPPPAAPAPLSPPGAPVSPDGDAPPLEDCNGRPRLEV